jgi:hypothetical protein
MGKQTAKKVNATDLEFGKVYAFSEYGVETYFENPRDSFRLKRRDHRGYIVYFGNDYESEGLISEEEWEIYEVPLSSLYKELL